MNCEQSQELMMKYFDGDFNDIENQQFKQHLMMCGKCNEDFKQLGSILNFIGDAVAVEPPQDFEANVMEKVHAFELEKKKKMGKMLMLLYNLTAVISIALLIVFFAGMKGATIPETLKLVDICIGSLAGTISAMLSALSAVFSLMTGVFRTLFQVGFSIITDHYYIFLTLMAILVAIQKMFFVLVEQDRGR
jgi:predicted anti-sigma-YlaC factor YlaD